MADMLLEQLANDGINRRWDETKRQVALQLEALGMTESRAVYAVLDAIRYRNEGLL
jgi:antitoxin component of RelBE/YafQ-DinJ toxin-antitoxin module